MKISLKTLLLLTALLLLQSFNTLGRQDGQDRAADLRAQLAEVQAQQADLQVRLTQIEEAMKPENIASGLAGVGSVHPEDLREQRRQQLKKEKAGVATQLELLAISQRRLETAVARADAAAYQQSAEPNYSGTVVKGPNEANTVDSSRKRRSAKRHRRSARAPGQRNP